MLRAVVDRAEALHRDLLAELRLAGLAFRVVERDVESVVAFPLAGQAGEGSPFTGCCHGDKLQKDDGAKHLPVLHLVERVLDLVELDGL